MRIGSKRKKFRKKVRIGSGSDGDGDGDGVGPVAADRPVVPSTGVGGHVGEGGSVEGVKHSLDDGGHGYGESKSSVEDGGVVAGSKASKTVKVPKAKKKAKKKASVLSFGDEEGDDDETPVVRRDHKQLRKKKRPRSAIGASSKPASQSTATRTPSSNFFSSTSAGRYSVEALQSLKKTQLRRVATVEDEQKQEAMSGVMGGDEADKLISEALAMDAGDLDGEGGSDGDMKRMAQEAREKREAARAQDDYIPLTGSKPSSKSSTKPSKSVRFAPDTEPRSAADRRLPGSEHKVDASQDGVIDDWEDSIIKRGSAGKAVSTPESRPRSSRPADSSDPEAPVALSTLRDRLSTLAADAAERKAKRQRRIVDLETRRAQTKTDIVELQAKLKEHGVVYDRYQRIRTYMGDLCECMTEKRAMIDEVWSAFDELREGECASAQQKVHRTIDRLVKADIVSGLKMLLPSDGASKDVAPLSLQAATLSSRVKEAVGGLRGTAELRPSSLSDGAVVAPRTPEEETELAARKDALKSAAELVFADAAEEFVRLPRVKEEFIRWRASARESYDQVYASLSLPGVVAPLISHALLGWDPLEPPQSSSGDGSGGGGGEGFRIDTWGWFDDLWDYSTPSKEEEEAGAPEPSADDEGVIPRVVQAAVIPRVAKAIQAWNVLDSDQARHLLEVLEECLNFEPEEAAVKDLLASIIVRLKLASAELPAYFVADDSGKVGDSTLVCLVLAMKTIINACLFKDLVNPSVLAQTVLENTFNKAVLPILFEFRDLARMGQRSQATLELFSRINHTMISTLLQCPGVPKHPGAKPVVQYLESIRVMVDTWIDDNDLKRDDPTIAQLLAVAGLRNKFSL